MQVQLRALHLSPLGLLVVALTSLPGYLLITLATFLRGEIFLGLIGALAASHLVDRLFTALTTWALDDTSTIQRESVDIAGEVMPTFGQTVVSPGIRRLTAMLAVLVAGWYGDTSLVVAGTALFISVYVEYVEQTRSFTSILSGVVAGCVGAAPFAAWILTA